MKEFILFTGWYFTLICSKTRWRAWAKHVTRIKLGQNIFNDFAALSIYGGSSLIYTRTFSQNVSLSGHKLRKVHESCNIRVMNFAEFPAGNEIRIRVVNAHFPTYKMRYIATASVSCFIFTYLYCIISNVTFNLIHNFLIQYSYIHFF